MEDDFAEEKDIDDNDSEADSVDSYDRSKKIENLMYDASEVLEMEHDVEENERMVDYDFQVAEEKKNPREKSYWKDPSVDLIGKKILKDFGIQGVYAGVIMSWKHPYFKVRYTDGDEDECSLKEIPSMLDVDEIINEKEGGNDEDMDALIGEDDNDMDPDDETSLDDLDSNADSKSTSTRAESISTATVLTRDKCEINDILKVQEVLLSHLYDQTNSLISFNKVNDGKDVDKIAALQILQYGELHHMSRTEGDEYLKSLHKLIETVTHKPFDMVKSYKTLKKGFLHRVDKKVPISYVEIRLPERFFHAIRIRGNRPLPSLKAAHIPLEVAIGTLLLRMSPDDLLHDMKPEYWRGVDKEGEPSVQRIYTDWCSSRYACDVQELVRNSWDTDHDPLIIYVSCFVDGGLMSHNNRSATQVSIAVQNVRNEKFQSLIGFVPEDCGISEEVLDSLLEKQGINKTNRKFILQCSSRQRLWDYLSSIFTPFMQRQEARNGFDCQVGTGANKKYYRVYVVLTNFLGDSPQMHALTGVSNSACHLCMCTNFADFRIDDTDFYGNNGTTCDMVEPRQINLQFNAGVKHVKLISSFINKEEGSNTREAQKKRKHVIGVLKSLKGYSGVNRVFGLFKVLVEEGVKLFCMCLIFMKVCCYQLYCIVFSVLSC